MEVPRLVKSQHMLLSEKNTLLFLGDRCCCECYGLLFHFFRTAIQGANLQTSFNHLLYFVSTSLKVQVIETLEKIVDVPVVKQIEVPQVLLPVRLDRHSLSVLLLCLGFCDGCATGWLVRFRPSKRL